MNNFYVPLHQQIGLSCSLLSFMPSSAITFTTSLFLEKIQNRPKELWASNIKLSFVVSTITYALQHVSSQFLQPDLLTHRLPIHIAMATLVRSFSLFPLSVPIKEIHHTLHPCFHYMENCMVIHSPLHLHHHNIFHFLSSGSLPRFP